MKCFAACNHVCLRDASAACGQPCCSNQLAIAVCCVARVKAQNIEIQRRILYSEVNLLND